MASPILNQSESANRTLLKSWSSSILFHLFLFLGLLYWFGSPESGLGNRDGSLMNFNKVGLEIKNPQSVEFEQRPEENQTEDSTSDSSETTSAKSDESQNPFDKLPATLEVTPLNEPDPVIGFGTPSSADSSLSSGGNSTGESILQEASGNLPPQATAPLGIGESSFLGMRTKGEKVIFLLDRSSSMDSSFHESKLKPLAVAKAELKRSLNSLSSTHEFQIIFYHETTQALGSSEDAVKGIKLLPVSELNLNKAMNFVDQIRADRGTHHLKALHLALSLHPDVIYFLTDADTQLDPGQLQTLKRMSKNTIINCVEFGKGPQMSGVGTQERNFMQRLAADTGGLYRYFDITRF
ncbi:MAG: hypothetical protein R3C11_23380 [Planctomycetaceae bacterium]